MSPIEKPKQVDSPTNHYPAWSPRFWHGMRTRCWWRLLAANRFRVSWSKLHIAAGVTLFSPVNDLLAISQAAIFGRRIAATKIEKPPLFILGHWRSGTTLLHELMVADQRFVSPNTFQCFAPSHFLITEPLMVRFGGFLMPKRRPMDNMEAGWLLPQEDEFALMNLGVPSPYLRIGFPQTQDKLFNYLSMTGLSEEELRCWREHFLWFLKVLTYHYGGKQLVLKSPPHTGRIAELADLFPTAKFIHLTRDPCKLFTSTLRLWRSLEAVQAMQVSQDQQSMQDYVAASLSTMYDRFEQARGQVDPARIVDVRYEDLVANPLDTVRDLYERLEIGQFESVEPELRQRLSEHDQYQTNRHTIDEGLQNKVMNLWSDYAIRYGYRE